MMGFLRATRRAIRLNFSWVPERLQIEKYHVGLRVVLPEPQHVVAADVGLVAERHEARDAESAAFKLAENGDSEATDWEENATWPGGGGCSANVAFIRTWGEV